MTVPVRYHCPHCETIVTLERDPVLADKSVTPYPLVGWTYVSPSDDVESANGVRFVCGETGRFEEAGCGEPFYLNYVRFEDGQEVEPDPDPETESVHLGLDSEPRWPRGPSGPPGPRGP